MSVEQFLTKQAGAQSSSQDSEPDFNGKWKNRVGSEMELKVSKNGALTGTYRTGIGLPKPDEEFRLRGFVSGDLIVFCVDFGRYHSLTSWAGQHTQDGNGKEVIYTLWHLAQNVRDEDEPDDLQLVGILAGANEYRRK